MLFLIGLGLTPKQLTLEALHAIQACDSIFAENYTSHYAEGTIRTLEKIIHRNIQALNRDGVEDNSEDLLKLAENQVVGLLVFGNPLTATTHISLLEECARQKIQYRVIPGVSIFNYRGMCGLDEYRFGRTTTFVFPQEGYEPLSTFDVITQNQKIGLHTHCLFDLHPDKQRYMSVVEAIEFLERAAIAREIPIVKWNGVGLAGMGNQNQIVRGGKLSELKKKEWNIFPQSLIVCGELTSYEKTALDALGEMK